MNCCNEYGICTQGPDCPARLPVPAGYITEELERDNPYNQWVHEHITDPEPEDEPEEDDGYCYACAGTGEGRYDGSSCSSCGGKGYVQGKADPDDFDLPDEPDTWIGPL